MLYVKPTTITEAKKVVADLHRHHKPPQGALFAVAVAHRESDEICGVAIIGRPVARHLQDGWTCEVTRVATDGTRNACSMLYGAARRAAKALGYRRVITYTLESECGASLRAAGFECEGKAGGGSWNCKARPRQDKHPTCPKQRWSWKCNPNQPD